MFDFPRLDIAVVVSVTVIQGDPNRDVSRRAKRRRRLKGLDF